MAGRALADIKEGDLILAAALLRAGGPSPGVGPGPEPASDVCDSQPSHLLNCYTRSAGWV